MSLRVSTTGLGLAVRYNKPYGLVPVGRNNKRATYCAVLKKETEMSKEQEKKPSDQPVESKNADMMTESFGEGYGTRSDEEGFGGIYGGNDRIEYPGHLVNHPDYDKSQGCEVKEKEKGRNARECT